MTNQELFSKADYYKAFIDRNRPFDKEQVTELDHYFRIGLAFSNNSMEGNSLTLQETKQFLEDGITADRNSMKDYQEAAGHAEAYDYMLAMARTDNLELTEAIIRKLHLLYYHQIDPKEAGQYRKVELHIAGTKQTPPAPEDVPHFMEHFINQMQSSRRFMHPIEFAAICHKRLLDLQPFIAGNGIIARLFMNLILVNAGYGITSISPVLRSEYSKALELSQGVNNPDIDAFIKLIAECVIEAEKEYCRLLKIDNAIG